MDLIEDLIKQQCDIQSETEQAAVHLLSKKRLPNSAHDNSAKVPPKKVPKSEPASIRDGDPIAETEEAEEDQFGDVADENNEDDEVILDEDDPACSLVEVLGELEEVADGSTAESKGSRNLSGSVNVETTGDIVGISHDGVRATPRGSCSVAGPSYQHQRATTAAEQQQQQEDDNNRTEDRKLLALMAHFNDDQLNRFEMFRRATFTKSSVSRNVLIAMAGITKVFVGEIVETALDYKDELKEQGPLQPKHIRVAFSRLREQQRISRPNRMNPLR